MNRPTTAAHETTIEVRVRYNECDPMKFAHHSSYVTWLEMARTELLRERGFAYRELEERGILMVVARLSLKYRRPARYDDVIQIRCCSRPTAGVKLEHTYEVRRGDELLATAETTLVVVDEKGRMKPVPPEILADQPASS